MPWTRSVGLLMWHSYQLLTRAYIRRSGRVKSGSAAFEERQEIRVISAGTFTPAAIAGLYTSLAALWPTCRTRRRTRR